MKCEKKFCPLFSNKVTLPAVASPKEYVYEQMTYNPAFTVRNKIFGHVSHSTELVRMCLASQHFDFNSADWTSDNLHAMSG